MAETEFGPVWPLAALNGQRPAAPAWFRDALNIPFETIRTTVAGAEIELLCWGSRGKPGILLLHGSVAHAMWWIALAPLLARDMRVCALSFSGNGGSDWRPRYSIRQMAEEGWAAAEAGGLFEGQVAPIVAAHSFGGEAAALMAGYRGDRLLGTIFVDTLIIPGQQLEGSPSFKPRSYADEAAALSRFRLSPDQPADGLFIIDEIGRAGIRRNDDGTWRWAFDPDFFRKLDYQSGWDEATNAQCPLAFLRGERSLVVSPASEQAQRAAMRADSIFVEIADAHHHIMIDQPLALVAAMRSICAGWIMTARR